MTLGLLATVLLLRGSFNKAEHGVIPGEGPAEATSGGRRGLEVVTTPFGGGHRRMRRWLMLQVDVLGCELDGVFIHHHEKVEVLVGFTSLIAGTWFSFDMHLFSNCLADSLSELLRGDLHLLTAGFDK